MTAGILSRRVRGAGSSNSEAGKLEPERRIFIYYNNKKKNTINTNDNNMDIDISNVNVNFNVNDNNTANNTDITNC